MRISIPTHPGIHHKTSVGQKAPNGMVTTSTTNPIWAKRRSRALLASSRFEVGGAESGSRRRMIGTISRSPNGSAAIVERTTNVAHFNGTCHKGPLTSRSGSPAELVRAWCRKWLLA